jgi:outer membrane murein-binding lipoprotein Lpp
VLRFSTKIIFFFFGYLKQFSSALAADNTLLKIDKNKMSIIQKLENSYVAILRVVVIVVATVLLVAAAVMGVMSLKGMLPASQAKIEIGSVDPKDVLAEVAPGEKRIASDAGQHAAESDQAKINPYLADYEKAYAAVASFVNKTSKNTLEIDKARFFSILDGNVAGYDVEEVKAKYISGLAAAFAASSGDKRLIARVEKPLASKPRPEAAAQTPAQAPVQVGGEEPAGEQPVPAPEPVVEEKPFKESPFVVIDEVLTAYNKMFNQKLAEAREKQEASVAEHMEAKVSAATRMYIAAGLFGTFLLVIFLTIAIRIERNMREIAARP